MTPLAVLSALFDPSDGDGIPCAFAILFLIILPLFGLWLKCCGGEGHLDRLEAEQKCALLAEELEFDRTKRSRRLAERDRLRELLAERSSDESE